MLRHVQTIVLGIALGALIGGVAPTTRAGTIIKLDLGTVSPDIKFIGDTLSTAGDQNTAAIFETILDPFAVDILTPTASFTMDGLTRSGQAFVLSGPGGSSVLQNFTGGTFSLRSPTNALLLSGTLAPSALSGPIGHSSGALFTTSFGTITGGSLKKYIAPGSLVLSMSFTAVSSGGTPGYSVTPAPDPLNPPVFTLSPPADLNPFTADASIIMEGAPRLIPEPASRALVLLGGGLIFVAGRRENRG